GLSVFDDKDDINFFKNINDCRRRYRCQSP
ncbi:hypothetical protein A2U01_0042478, partial [Trifolium medium]|nr:hypothetical protein [Trifolium medium]